MDWKEMAKTMESTGGLVTAESMASRLDVSKKTAINYISELRERGFVETDRGRAGKRIYRISPVKRIEIGYPGLYETLNKYSPVKLVEPFKHRIYDHELTVEEAVVRAVATRNFRVILSSLALFSRIENWPRLYRFAKSYRVERYVGAMYDLSRKCLRVRRMDGRIRNRLKAAKVESKHIIEGTKSRDFTDIEREWDVSIPFNKSDLERYGG